MLSAIFFARCAVLISRTLNKKACVDASAKNGALDACNLVQALHFFFIYPREIRARHTLFYPFFVEYVFVGIVQKFRFLLKHIDMACNIGFSINFFFHFVRTEQSNVTVGTYMNQVEIAAARVRALDRFKVGKREPKKKRI